MRQKLISWLFSWLAATISPVITQTDEIAFKDYPFSSFGILRGQKNNSTMSQIPYGFQFCKKKKRKKINKLLKINLSFVICPKAMRNFDS